VKAGLEDGDQRDLGSQFAQGLDRRDVDGIVERGGRLEGTQGGEDFVGDAEGPTEARAAVDGFEADGV